MIALAASMAGADDTKNPPQALAPGDLVRVVVQGERRSIQATIESVTDEELVLRRQGILEPLRLDPVQVRTLDVARGRRSQWLRGAAIGFVPGALILGLAGGHICGTYGDRDDCPFNPLLAIPFGLIGGAMTAPVGAVIGLAFKTDRWERVHERKPRVSLVVAPVVEGARVGLSLSF